MQLAIDAAKALVEKGKSVRVISFPSWELFSKQPKEYQDSVLLPSVQNRVAIEAGIKNRLGKMVG